ncbi:MAG TPA: hypothetical protein PKD54_04865 [Pirellulaceae bacterium]|nr:hypothetical protein [Pirellulaceae bacterium]
MPTSNIIHRSRVAKSERPDKVVVGCRDRQPSEVKLHRDGDTVKAIEIQCSCGERIVIQCEYE